MWIPQHGRPVGDTQGSLGCAWAFQALRCEVGGGHEFHGHSHLPGGFPPSRAGKARDGSPAVMLANHILLGSASCSCPSHSACRGSCLSHTFGAQLTWPALGCPSPATRTISHQRSLTGCPWHVPGVCGWSAELASPRAGLH